MKRLFAMLATSAILCSTTFAAATGSKSVTKSAGSSATTGLKANKMNEASANKPGKAGLSLKNDAAAQSKVESPASKAVPQNSVHSKVGDSSKTEKLRANKVGATNKMMIDGLNASKMKAPTAKVSAAPSHILQSAQ